MSKQAVIIELEWLNRDYDYVWYVLFQNIYEDLMEEGAEPHLIEELDNDRCEILAKFGGPGKWDFDHESNKAHKWCKNNGWEVVDVIETSADAQDMD